MSGPYRLVWSMVGRSLILDSRDHEAINPGVEIGAGWTPEVAAWWERVAPVIVKALNEDWNRP